MTNRILLPYRQFIVTALPIFLIIYFVPAHASTPLHFLIDNFIETHLLGYAGFWTSHYPFSSKITTNYISIFGPGIAISVFYKTYPNINLTPLQMERIEKLGGIKYSLFSLCMIVIFYFILTKHYLYPYELISQKNSLSVLGKHKILYSLYSTLMLFGLYLMPVIFYIYFILLPHKLFKRWKVKKPHQ